MSAPTVERDLTASARKKRTLAVVRRPARLLHAVPAPRAEARTKYHPLVDVMLTVLGTGLLALLLGASPALTGGCLLVWATWMLVLELGGTGSVTPRGPLKAGMQMGALVAVASVVGAFASTTAFTAWWIIGTAAVGSACAVVARFRHSPARRVLLVGARSAITKVAAEFAESRSTEVVGYCVTGGSLAFPEQSPRRLATTSQVDGLATTSRLDDVPELVTVLEADTVMIVPGNALSEDELRRLSWSLEELPVVLAVASPVAGVAPRRMSFGSVGGSTVLRVEGPRPSPGHRAIKEVVDRLGALLLLAVSAPLFLVMWAAVRLDTAGPGFFVQTRIGRDGRPFRMFKFRTMHLDAESLRHRWPRRTSRDGLLFKIRRDPRVTRVGYWLRRSSLDELPQLFNVLRGEMSLVGPRPALPSEVADLRRRTRIGASSSSPASPGCGRSVVAPTCRGTSR